MTTLGALFIGVTGILLLFGLWEEGNGIRVRRDRSCDSGANRD